MNIFLRELKAGRKALVIWCVCMVLGVLSGMFKYTAYSGDAAGSRALMALPYSLRALLGMGASDPTTMGGYFAMLYFYLAIAAAIFAALLGSGATSSEERGKTAEFLLAKPVSRTVVVTAKLTAALTQTVIFNLITLLSCVWAVDAYNKGKSITGEIVVFMLAMLIVQFIFLSLGALVGAAAKKPAKAGAAASAIVMGAFLVTEITNLNEKLGFLNVLSPFHYFDVTRVLNGRGLNPAIVILSLLLAAVFTALTFVFYKKRDVQV